MANALAWRCLYVVAVSVNFISASSNGKEESFPSPEVHANFSAVLKPIAPVASAQLKKPRAKHFCTFCNDDMPRALALRVENPEDMVPNQNGMIAMVRPDVEILITLFGNRLDQVAEVLFSPRYDCDQEQPDFRVTPLRPPFVRQSTNILRVSTHFPVPEVDEIYYVCLLSMRDQQQSSLAMTTSKTRPKRQNQIDDEDPAVTYNTIDDDYETPEPPTDFVFQGDADHLIFYVTEKEDEEGIPTVLKIVLVAFLLCLSGLFSGLTLGLMSLDQTELLVFMNSGTRREKAYAKKIYPVRKRGNYLLCSILYGNVVVNSAISILFGDLTSGPIGLVCSSLAIVVLGEILPQSLCSRYTLAIGARTIWITKCIMVLTAPLSWPTSKVLDRLVGKEVAHSYNRERMLELIRLNKDLTSELENCQEVAIVTGALELSNKRVTDVMTPIDEVFMLAADAKLDTKTISEIAKSGFTRIPVFDGDRENVVMILNVKDLAEVNPQEGLALRTLCRIHRYEIHFVAETILLSEMLEEFKRDRYHMAFVRKSRIEPSSSSEEDRLLGVITMEDIIEEILQSEILDEFDLLESEPLTTKFSDNLKSTKSSRDLTALLGSIDDDQYAVSPQIAIVAYQYLITSVAPFGPDVIDEQILQQLVRQNLRKSTEVEGAPRYLYEKGTPADYFVLILEGTAEVTSNIDAMTFEAGKFFSFGMRFLVDLATAVQEESTLAMSFEPDYSAKIVSNLTFFQLSANDYVAAVRASLETCDLTRKQSHLLWSRHKSSVASARTDESFRQSMRSRRPTIVNPESALAFIRLLQRGSRSESSEHVELSGEVRELIHGDQQNGFARASLRNSSLKAAMQRRQSSFGESERRNS